MEKQILVSLGIRESKCEHKCLKVKNCRGKPVEEGWSALESEPRELEAEHAEEGIAVSSQEG